MNMWELPKRADIPPYRHKNKLYLRTTKFPLLGFETKPVIERCKADEYYSMLGTRYVEIKDNEWTLWYYPLYD